VGIFFGLDVCYAECLPSDTVSRRRPQSTAPKLARRLRADCYSYLAMNVKFVVQRNGQSAQTFGLRSVEMIVGRQKGCGVRIPSAMVSRQHCLVTYQDDLLAVEDLSSANGTFINGRRIAKREFLRPGDKLKIGPVTLLVQYQLSQAAIDRLLKEGDEGVSALPLDDVEVVPEAGGQDAEVELVLDAEDNAPLVMDEPIELTPDGDPLEALRAIEAKSGGATTVPPPPPHTTKKKKTSGVPAQRPLDDVEVVPTPPPPPQRVKLAKTNEPLAPAASGDEPLPVEDDLAETVSPDASQILGPKNWQLPTGEDIRDILSQIEKGKKKP
jgi:predicted component of type VI protein secretion system